MLQALPRSCWVPYDPPDMTQARDALQQKAQQKQDSQKQQSTQQTSRVD